MNELQPMFSLQCSICCALWRAKNGYGFAVFSEAEKENLRQARKYFLSIFTCHFREFIDIHLSSYEKVMFSLESCEEAHSEYCTGSTAEAAHFLWGRLPSSSTTFYALFATERNWLKTSECRHDS